MKQICRSVTSIIFCNLVLLESLFAFAINDTARSVSRVESSIFNDVYDSDWYYDSVYACRQTGIFVGDDANEFHPAQSLTAQESYAVLARLYQWYTGDDRQLAVKSGENWSTPYRTYCVEHRIMTQAEAESYTVLNRELFALFLSRIFDLSAVHKFNNITDIVDYNVSSDLGKSVLSLYQTGIFAGTDVYGSFSPLSELSRAECAAIVTRLVDPKKRVEILESPAPLTIKLNFMSVSDTNMVYDFDGKYIYQISLSDEETPEYFVTDLYGRKIITAKKRISRQHDGIFKWEDSETNQTFFVNTKGELIYQASTSFTDYSFLYGKLAIDQSDGSILIVDTQGREVKTIDTKGMYRVAGAAFGDCILVAPNENQDHDHSYWLNIQTGIVTELPYSTDSALTAKGHEYIVVNSYSESDGRYFYNAIDTSLTLLFPQVMESVRILEDGVLFAEDHDAYYMLEAGAKMDIYPKDQYGKIEQFSLLNRVLRYTIDGKTQIANLKMEEIYATFSDIDTYSIIGRKIIRPRNINGETVIDLFNEYGGLEQEGIPCENIWYGNKGQILYRIANQYYYVSA